MTFSIEKYYKERLKLNIFDLEKLVEQTLKVDYLLEQTFKINNKAYIFGNGGSDGDASHFATELVVKIKHAITPLPVLTLNNSSIVSAISNDLGCEHVYSRQIAAYLNKDDVAIGISTSGKSKNILEAISKANQKGGITIGLTGNSGILMEIVHYKIEVPSDETQYIQEAHRIILHAMALDIYERFKTSPKSERSD